MPNGNRDKTVQAASLQMQAMGSEVFEVGLFKPNGRGREPFMLSRLWDPDSLIRSIGWLRYQNSAGRHIYIRPHGEHNLSLVDDLKADAIAEMTRSGFNPTVVTETSPGNFQAWLKHPEQLSKELGTAVARALADKFGGDRGAADWRHYGRLVGFTNRKASRRDAATGLYPFVRLVNATGEVYREAGRFLSQVRSALEQQREIDERRRAAFARSHSSSAGQNNRFKSIDEFRADPRYGQDGTRIDLAFAIYAFSHGSTPEEVEAAIRTRDLSHKGPEKRQADYIDRTVKKAIAAIERGRGR